MGETITLPRSGVVLTRGGLTRESWYGHSQFMLQIVKHMEDPAFQACLGMHWYDSTRDECIAWLDARVLELRAALLPPGAIVLRPEDARETIAEALWNDVLRERYCEEDDWDDVPECKRGPVLEQADAVLKALAALAERGRG